MGHNQAVSGSSAFEPQRLDAISRTIRVSDGWLIEPRPEFPEVSVLFSNNRHGKIVRSPRNQRNKVCLAPGIGCALFLKVYTCGVPAWDMLLFDGMKWIRPEKPSELLVTRRLALCWRYGSQVVGFPPFMPSEILERWKKITLRFLK